MSDCSEAVKLDPRGDNFYNTRGAIYHLTGKYDQAFRDSSRALQLNPNSPDAMHKRGMAYAAKGDHDTAIAAYNG